MRGDESSLTQCLTNLVGNAVKFVAPGTIPWVRICSQAQEGNGRLWIEDNGIGIQLDNNTRLFETFQRMPEARSYDGEGVGLAIVRRAVERMGGRVGVESEPGKGSRFWIELPVAAEGAVHIS
jgi:signal transduction histidine kinase